jgi:hypothetical protein
MTREQIEQIWRDPRSRKCGVYFSKADPRIIVPRRCGGWTPNFAHPGAVPTTLLLAAVLIVPVWILASKGAGGTAIIATLAAAIVAVCWVCHYLAGRSS